MKVEDYALDLAVCMTIVSSLKDACIGQHVCFAAEVSLSGEIRGVNWIEDRIAEAQKLGFHTMIISTYNQKNFHYHPIICTAQ